MRKIEVDGAARPLTGADKLQTASLPNQAPPTGAVKTATTARYPPKIPEVGACFAMGIWSPP